MEMKEKDMDEWEKLEVGVEIRYFARRQD